MFYLDLDLELYSPGGPKFLREVGKICQISGKTRLLEVGASAGYCSRFLARQFGCRALATDINPAWIPIIEKKAKRDGVGDRVSAQREDVLGLSFARESFDVVLANGVLYFTDKEKALEEINRVLKTRGFLAIGDPIWKKEDTPFQVRRVLEVDQAELLTSRSYKDLVERKGFRVVSENLMPPFVWEEYYKPLEERIREWKGKGAPFYTKYSTEIDKMVEEMETVRTKRGQRYVGYELLVGQKVPSSSPVSVGSNSSSSNIISSALRSKLSFPSP